MNRTLGHSPDAMQALLDIEEIKQLKARYFRTVDAKDYAGFREVFTDDARIAGTFSRGEDIDAFVRDVERRHKGVVTVHRGGDPEIKLTGADTAEGVWAMYDVLEWPPGASPPEFPGFRGFRGYGHYHETYRREAAGWRIATLELRRQRVDAF